MSLFKRYFSQSGQPNVPLDRGFLSRELNIREDRNSGSVWVHYIK
jgi:hypothetical protein